MSFLYNIAIYCISVICTYHQINQNTVNESVLFISYVSGCNSLRPHTAVWTKPPFYCQSYFIILGLPAEKLLSLSQGDLVCSMSPSGQINYLSPPSISRVGIMRHGNRGFNTVAKTSPRIRTVNHPKAHFNRCCHFSHSSDLYRGKSINYF